jgi:hypothetical protein
MTKQGTVPIKMVLIFGPPTADPKGKEIPLTIKEMLMNDRPLDYFQRKMIVEWIGGEDALAALAHGF